MKIPEKPQVGSAGFAYVFVILATYSGTHSVHLNVLKEMYRSNDSSYIIFFMMKQTEPKHLDCFSIIL